MKKPASSRNKLVAQRIVVIGGTSGCVAVPPSPFSPPGNTRLTNLAPPRSIGFGCATVLLDHIVFTSVDRIIRGPLEHTDIQRVQELFGVKFWGSVVVAKALAKHDIVSPGGSLTLTSGVAGVRGSTDASVGGAMNGGVISLTKGLAMDLAAKRIRVNTVVPGVCQTELWDKQGHSKQAQEEVLAKFAAELSVGFVGSPEGVAETYLFFIRANYANGTTVIIGELSCFYPWLANRKNAG